MKPIHQYRNYRDALRDHYLGQKSSVSGYTYAAFSKKAGLSSPNYLKLVMDGTRNLTTANIQAFGKAMGLRADEIEYFEALVLENQAESPQEKRYYGRRVTRLRKAGNGAFVREAPSDVLASKLKSAILLCAHGKDAESAAQFASEELRLPLAQSKAVIAELVEGRELKQDGEGKLAMQSLHTMMSDPKSLSEKQRMFLQDSIQEVSTVFRVRYPQGAAKFLSILMTAHPGSLEPIFAELLAAVEKSASEHNPEPDSPEALYRVQLQVYRLARDEK